MERIQAQPITTKRKRSPALNMPFIPKSNANSFFFFNYYYYYYYVSKTLLCTNHDMPTSNLQYICQKNNEICAIKLFKLIDIPRYYNATLKAWHSLWMWSDYQFESMT